ncbi:chromosome segregation protein [Alkaliphilus hydrothermalis]|uniref:Chromosome partition protein Smc n=1 Tax=Alkaliphilus hydrothermalis TaxID=1482730 RepID=A0ABS2NM22_9FIRM|nr:chromosome segregation protein SMC [Alkaliphilus hydrothermalis]MBM7613629.1 chromosome segregation protein [Alkaliphilus hydrothermalis]
MYLKRLDIQGFKSFADKIDMHFEGGITGVVGPNGSGKSNISDSIRWVLGEQSPKSLRGSKMEDVIFAGTTSRRPVGMAEVSLTLDNTSQMLPIDYGEVTITRRVYRSGESEYYLNKSSCRLKDIRELLMDTGIGKEGYSIIGQGKIDEILSSKPEDRRLIFEEAAGIVKYKNRRDEAEKKLSSTKDNLSRVADILHELENQLEPLRRQSNKAKKYKDLRNGLIKLEVNLFIQEIDKIDGDLKMLLEQIESIKDSIEQQTKIKLQHQGSMEKINNQLKQQEEEFGQIQNQYYQSENSIKSKEGIISLNQEKITHNDENLHRIRLEIDNIQQSEKTASEELERKLQALEAKGEELESLKKHLTTKISQYEAQTKVNSSKEEDLEKSKALIIDTLNEISDKKSELNSLRTLIKTMDDRLQQVQGEVKRYQDQVKANGAHMTQLENDLIEIEELIRNTESEGTKVLKSRGELEKNLYQVTKDLNERNNQLNHKKSRKNLLEELEKEHDGFNKSVKNILTACEKNPHLGRGIHGVVADLIKVPKGYELAIETALGAAIQNIVSESEEDGKRIIDHMKHNNLGRITILPISALQPRGIHKDEKEMINDCKEVQVAFDLVEVDEKFQGVFSNLLSRVLIVPNLDIGIQVARKLQHRFKIVTIDGDVLNIGGSMTGGSAQKQGSGILGRKRELEDLTELIDVLNKEIEERRQKLDEIQNQHTEINRIISEINQRQQENRIKEVTIKNKLEQIMAEKQQLMKTLQQFTQEVGQLESVKMDSEEKLKVRDSEICLLESKISDTQQQVSYFHKDLQSEKGLLEAINNEITQDKVKVAGIEGEKNALLLEIDGLKKSIRNYKELIYDKEKGIGQHREKNHQLQEALEKQAEELNQLKLLAEELNAQMKNLKVRKNEILKSETEVKRKLGHVEKVIGELQESSHKLDLRRTRLEMQQQSFYNKLWEEYELTYNSAQGYKEEISDLGQVQREIKKYKDEIKFLGSINLEAIDEYDKVKERYEFMKQQQGDLVEAKDSLADVIKEMEKTMAKQFLEQFEIIKKNFNEVFAKLFGGGKADLILEANGDILNCGIDINAQPPGKKLQNLSLLSGGERALTAISLLFAILLVKPSPFCILDEIEAALDDANVKRFASFLKELSETTQFIVVTHRKGTMEMADVLYGVTMEEEGVSKLVSVKLTDNNEVIAS